MEEICLTLIPPYQVETSWPVLGPWIVQAVGEDADASDVTYIKHQAETGQATIMALTINGVVGVVLVCESALFGGKKTLVLRWLSGAKINDWLKYYSYVEEHAFQHGYERIEVWGRKGWEKQLRPYGFWHEFTVLGKFVTKRVH